MGGPSVLLTRKKYLTGKEVSHGDMRRKAEGHRLGTHLKGLEVETVPNISLAQCLKIG
jgi:hypothetical protein